MIATHFEFNYRFDRARRTMFRPSCRLFYQFHGPSEVSTLGEIRRVARAVGKFLVGTVSMRTTRRLDEPKILFTSFRNSLPACNLPSNRDRSLLPVCMLELTIYHLFSEN